MFRYCTQKDEEMHVLCALELSALPDVKLFLHAFLLFDEIDAKASLVQHDVCVLGLRLQAFQLLAVTGASVSFVQHYGHVSLSLEFETYRHFSVHFHFVD
jgi:hypothetical protein